LRQAERKVGQLTMENEILRVAAETRGLSMPPAKRPREPWNTVDARRARSDPLGRPGPATSISDADLLGLIHQVLAVSPFAGEGYRKVRARLRREHGIRVSGKRVLRLLRGAGLLAPQRARGRRKPRPHDGTIIPAAPNQRWGTDATMAWIGVPPISRRVGYLALKGEARLPGVLPV
jgi:hypothetical protein